MKRAIVLVCLVLLVVGGAAAWYFTKKTTAATPSFRTAPIKRGNVRATIDATGTVEPVEVIDVGAQVAGQVLEFGKDVSGKPIDFGSVVEEGTVLARIDTSLYTADLEQSKAQFAVASANRLSAESNVMLMKSKLEQAERDWNRAQKLGPSEALAPTTFDAYKATYESAKANLATAQAAVEQAKASIAAAQASLSRVEKILAYCTIKSPVKGVVIDRRVNIGQTVVSSLNAPSLFLIARDLTHIQVWVSVNEADIGNIKPGQPVTFTCDSFPGQTFHGSVGKVRLNATMTQNVVTYTVEVNTENADGRLLPYLTANAQFEIGRREDVLVVPNAALRFTPRANQVAADAREAVNTPAPGKTRAKGAESGEPKRAAQATLWIQQGGALRPIHATAGLSDGSTTEIEGEDVKEGLDIVVADLSPAPAGGGASQAAGGSPFVAAPMRGRGQPQSTSPAPAPAAGRP